MAFESAKNDDDTSPRLLRMSILVAVCIAKETDFFTKNKNYDYNYNAEFSGSENVVSQTSIHSIMMTGQYWFDRFLIVKYWTGWSCPGPKQQFYDVHYPEPHE